MMKVRSNIETLFMEYFLIWLREGLRGTRQVENVCEFASYANTLAVNIQKSSMTQALAPLYVSLTGVMLGGIVSPLKKELSTLNHSCPSLRIMPTYGNHHFSS